MKRLAVVMRDGVVVVTDAESGEQLDGVWRVELCATAGGNPVLTLFLDPQQHALEIDTASVRIDHRHRPAALSRESNMGGCASAIVHGSTTPSPKRP